MAIKNEPESGGAGEPEKDRGMEIFRPLSGSPHPPTVTSISISPGGIPKLPISVAEVTVDGIQGDGRAHAKHVKPTRAISLIEEHVVERIRGEGYAVGPGVMGENLTVQGLDLLALTPGTRLRFSGGVEIELVEPRKPCFVLDAIHPDLKNAVQGRFGYMARVVTEGVLRVGESIRVLPRVIGAILAGGHSRRMGRPKEGVVLWDGRPMIEHVVEAMQAVCPQVVIVGSCRGWTPEPPIIRLDDRQADLGPLGGIDTLLASGLANGYLVAGCDQPLLTPPMLRLLLNPPDPGVPCFLRAESGAELDPFPGYFPASWVSVARAALERGRRGLRDAVRSGRWEWVMLPETL
ncbi:MAG TPA: NTP transferase domain-containing protein, partial [Nitrospiria bacterium]|nr:NTP transferase domain-containing protein [Nitrospiria bacterium]